MAAHSMDSFVDVALPAFAGSSIAKDRRSWADHAINGLIVAVAAIALTMAFLHPVAPSAADALSQVTTL